MDLKSTEAPVPSTDLVSRKKVVQTNRFSQSGKTIVTNVLIICNNNFYYISKISLPLRQNEMLFFLQTTSAISHCTAMVTEVKGMKGVRSLISKTNKVTSQ